MDYLLVAQIDAAIKCQRVVDQAKEVARLREAFEAHMHLLDILASDAQLAVQYVVNLRQISAEGL